MQMPKPLNVHFSSSTRRARQTVATITLIFFLLLFPLPTHAATQVGMEFSTAFRQVAFLIAHESASGPLWQFTVPVDGDGVKLTYRSLLASDKFSFYSGPELVIAKETHNLTTFAGYGFTYGVAAGPARFSLHASLGLADGPALENSQARPIRVGNVELRSISTTGVGVALAF